MKYRLLPEDLRAYLTHLLMTETPPAFLSEDAADPLIGWHLTALLPDGFVLTDKNEHPGQFDRVYPSVFHYHLSWPSTEEPSDRASLKAFPGHPFYEEVPWACLVCARQRA